MLHRQAPGGVTKNPQGWPRLKALAGLGTRAEPKTGRAASVFEAGRRTRSGGARSAVLLAPGPGRAGQ
ncbi:MAG: hypothetical protein ACK54L_22705, partial [Betaproteobacteria bacterium]